MIRSSRSIQGFSGQAVLAGLALLAACGGRDTEAEGSPVQQVLKDVDTLVTTASGDLGHPTDIAVGNAGTIYVADARSNRVLVLETESGSFRTISRSGGGPGELARPSAVAAGDGGIVVFDASNSRVERFSRGGEYLDSRPAPPSALAAPVSLRGDGSIVVGSMGADSSLAVAFGPSGERVRAFGRPIAQPAMFDFASMKARIADGEVPDEFRNNVLALGDDDGGIWVAVQTEAEIRRYDRDGRLRWRVTVEDPQIQAARRAFFERNAELKGPAIAPLRYFADLAHGDGELWVLLAGGDDDPAIILTLDDGGRETRRIEVPAARGASSIDYDGVAHSLILGTAPDAQLLSVQLRP